MSNTTMTRLWALPGFLKRNNIFHAEGFEFGNSWIEGIIKSFESCEAIAGINYPVILFIEDKCYDGELEVRRDGSHAVRMIHAPAC